MAIQFAPPDDRGSIDLRTWVEGRVGSGSVDNVFGFLQQWDRLRDERHGKGEEEEPSLEDYAIRWKTPRWDAARELSLFRLAFPGEATPSHVLEELWAVRGRSFGDLLNAGVVPDSVAKPR